MHRYLRSRKMVQLKSPNLFDTTYRMKISGRDIRHAGGQIDLDEEESARGPLSYRSHRIRYFLHSYSLFLVYGQSSRLGNWKNHQRLSNYRQAARVFSSSCTLCLPFYMSSIKKARIKLAIFCDGTHNAQRGCPSARGKDGKREREIETERRGEESDVYTRWMQRGVGACYTTGSEATGRNKKVCVD